MKKNRMFDTKGFMLVETLLVSLTIAGILVYMYSQFSTINSSYQRLYNYNTTDTIYQVGAFKEFMMRYTTSGNSIYSGLGAVELNCSDLNLATSDESYCERLYGAIDPEIIILTKGQFNESTVLAAVSGEENKAIVKKFLKTVEQGSTTSYRLIVLYKDDRVVTLQYKLS